MAKRELMLVGAFAAAGVIAWRLTAPSPRPGEEGFSLSRVFRDLRAGLSAQRVEHEVRLVATSPAAGVRVLAVGDFAGDVTVVGEARSDISMELTGVAFGSDETGAAVRARDVRLTPQAKGDRLEIAIGTPSNGRRPRLKLLVRTPGRVGVSLQRVRGDVQLSDVASVEVDTRDGELRIEDVNGPVRGEHRDGQAEVTRVGDLRLSMRSGDVRLEHAQGAVECIVADGRLELRDAGGVTRLELERTETDLADLHGRVTIEARDSRVTLLDHRHPVEFEGERSHFSVALAAPAELRATSRDEGVEVTLGRDVGARLDLQAEDGNIRVPDPTLPIQRSNAVQKVLGEIGEGGAALTVRTERGDIVVRR